MPIEIGEVEVVPDPAPTAAATTAAPAPAASTGSASPAGMADQMRAWHRELAYRADRLRAD
jgi:hypothetical protein